MKTIIALVAGSMVLIAVGTSRANLAPSSLKQPQPKAAKPLVTVVVEATPKGTPVELVMPRKLYQALQKVELDEGQDSLAQAEGPSRLHTIVAGLALSLGVIGGGFWLVRRRRLHHAVAWGLAAIALLGIGAATLWANGVGGLNRGFNLGGNPNPFGNQPLNRGLAVPAFPLAATQLDRVRIVLSDAGTTIRLRVPIDMMAAPADKDAKDSTPSPR